MKDNSVLIVGSIALDTIEVNGQRYENYIGGSTTYATIAAGMNSDVYVVGIVGDDFPKEGYDIYAKYAANTTDLKVAEGSTFAWGGKYHENFDDRDTLFTELGVFAEFKPTLSPINMNHQFVFLANIHPVLQNSVIDQCRATPVIVIDTMNLWINNTLDDLLQVLGKSDILLINESEAGLLTELSDLDDAAKTLIGLGPPTVVIKQGSRGATLYTADQKISIGAYSIKKVVDPTGAGDTFGGGFISALAEGKSVIEALVRGTALASICVEDVGTSALLSATTVEIDARMEILREKVTAC